MDSTSADRTSSRRARSFGASLSLSASLLFGAVAVFAPSSAAAQPADADFEAGRKLLDQGDYAGACAKFGATFNTAQSAGKAFNLSVCEEKQGHLAKALEWMNRGTLLLSPTDDRRPDATKRQATLESRVPHLTISVTDPAVPGAVLTLDDQQVSAGTRFPVDPGTHRVRLHADQHTDAMVEVRLNEGENRPVPIGFAAGSSGTTPPGGSSGNGSPGNGQLIAGVTVGGVGILGLIGFGVSAGLVASTKSEYEKTPTASVASKGKSEEIAEGVLLGVGAAASITGLVVILTAPKKVSSPRAALRIGAGYVGVSGEF